MRILFTFPLPFILILFFAVSTQASGKILFIKGGENTGGFLEPQFDDHLTDITEYSTENKNHGWGELADALTGAGFELEQIAEGPNYENCVLDFTTQCSDPVSLETMDFSGYSVLVFGSNNSRYGEPAVDAVWNFVIGGGGILFISDANYGRSWGDASASVYC